MNGKTKTVLLRGTGTDLGAPVATALLARGATVALHDAEQPARAAALADQLAALGLPGRVVDLSPKTAGSHAPAAPFEALLALDLRLDAVVHLYLPTVHTDEAEVLAYGARLKPMILEAVDHMQRIGSPGIVVNQFLMPTLFAGAPLGPAWVEARNALTALTRIACLRGGKQGVRTTTLLVGLLDLPSLHALAGDNVNAAKTPLGRWLRPDEVAGTLAFLALDSGYITGQMLVYDGGMTGGINGV